MIGNITQHIGLCSLYALGAIDQLKNSSDISLMLVGVTGALLVFLYGLVRDGEKRSQDKLKKQQELYEQQIKGIQEFYERSLGIVGNKKDDSSKQNENNPS